MIKTDSNIPEYIIEACSLLKKLGPGKINSFVQLYLIAYFNKFIKLNTWSETINQFDLRQLKHEAMYRINKELFVSFDANEISNIEIMHWLINNPPLDTTQDILGSIYLLCSSDSHRKRMGEHYTRTDLVEYIVNQLLELRKEQSKKIDELRIIDPACGSGNFIVEVLRRGIEGYSGDSADFLNRLSAGEFVVGVDIQEIACFISKVRMLMELLRSKIEFNCDLKLPIYNLNSLLSDNQILKENNFDVVVTNPPFLRYQSIDIQSRELISKKYKSCTGRYDLYTIFIEKAIMMAKNDGYIGIICSDMFMTSAYGKGIRKFVKETSTLLLVLDLREVFPFDAAVLSSAFFFTKTKNVVTPILNTVRVLDDSIVTIETIGSVEIQDSWRYADAFSEDVFIKIKENVKTERLGDLSNIFVGIKTTADSVYCKPITNIFIEENKLEKKLIKPLLRGINLKRWTVNWTGDRENTDTSIIYPYKQILDKTVPVQLEKFPNVERYLHTHKVDLESREYFKDSGKQWYELWVPVSHKTFEQIKIITPDIASKCTFVLDTKGFFCNGTVYGITLNRDQNIDNYKYLIGILNSKVIEFFHKKENPNKIHSHKFRFQTGTMKNYPIILKSETSNVFHELVEVVNQIENCENSIDLCHYESKLNQIVYKLYELNSNDIKIIERYTSSTSA
ncbi:N-6 DNA methylase [Paenibacillus oryzisoli]|uniref:Eco57I restriction-modification methylase domain-containing protein n=1 Tax=Paenibacillus oryzisoli TaxID=1850517 RepID=UPI003D292536